MENHPLSKKSAAKPKVSLKRNKKKPNLNVSVENLKSVNTPKKFNFLNGSVQKQSLRANNRLLARSLADSRRELRALGVEHQELKVAYQDCLLQISRLKRLVGPKDEAIEEEVQKRVQAHVKVMRSVLEELTQSMFQSSQIINTLNDKFYSFSRRSTDSTSSRADSLDVSQNRLSLNQRGSTALRNKKQNALMMEYLSHADEFSPPPFGDKPDYHVNKVDQSVIAEESFLGEDVTLRHPMLSVSENPSDVGNKRVKPAQRVLIDDNSQAGVKGKTGKTEETAPVIEVDLNEDKTKAAKKSSTKETGLNDEEVTDTPLDELGILEFSSDMIQLVSGSPISAGESEETVEKIQKNKNVCKKLIENDNKLKRQQTFVVRKEAKKTEEAKKVVSKSSTKSLKLSKVKIGSKSGNVTTTNVKTTAASKGSIRKDIPVTEGSFNPFKPTNVLLRSPPPRNMPDDDDDIQASPQNKVDSSQFLSSLVKPDERSSKMVPIQPEERACGFSGFAEDEHTMYFNSEMELTRVGDFGKMLQSSKLLSSQSSTLPPGDIHEGDEHEQSEEPLTNKPSKNTKSKGRLNRENEKETKAKTTKKEAQQTDLEEASATVEMRNKKPGVFTFSVGRKEADGTRKPVPEKPSRARSKKARNVTPEKEERKEGDDRDMFNFGDRTPTVSLEVLQTKSVYDMSMNESSVAPTSGFSNFKQTLKKDSDTKESNSETQHKDGHVYTVAVKDGSDKKKDTKSTGRSRSKSNTRSKTKKGEESDDEVLPDRKARSRSRGRPSQKKTSLDQEIEGRHEPEKQGASHNDGNVYSVPLKDENAQGAKKDKGRSRSKSNTRSKSKSRKGDESDDDWEPERKSRSRSRGRPSQRKAAPELDQVEDRRPDKGNSEFVEKPADIIQNVYSVPLKDSPEKKDEISAKNRSRSKSRTRSQSKSRQEEESNNENYSIRKSRSGSKKISDKNDLVVENVTNKNVDEEVQGLRTTEDKGDVYHEPLKDSPGVPAKEDKRRTRSKSRTRSQVKPIPISDSDDEQKMLLEKDKDHSEKSENIYEKGNRNENQIDNTAAGTYAVPLKDSPKVKAPKNDSSSRKRSKSRTRSKSRGRSVVVTDSEEESNKERVSRSRSKTSKQEDSVDITRRSAGSNPSKCADPDSNVIEDDSVKAKSKSGDRKLSTSNKKQSEEMTEKFNTNRVYTEGSTDEQLPHKKDNSGAEAATSTNSTHFINDASAITSRGNRYKSKSINYNEENPSDDDDELDVVSRKSVRKTNTIKKRGNVLDSDSDDNDLDEVSRKSIRKTNTIRKRGNVLDSDSDDNELDEVSRKSIRKTNTIKKKCFVLDNDSQNEDDIKPETEKNVEGKKPSTTKEKKSRLSLVTIGRRKTGTQKKSVNLNETFELEDKDLEGPVKETCDDNSGVNKSECHDSSKTPEASSTKSVRKINKRTVTKSKKKDVTKTEKESVTKSKSSRKLLQEPDNMEGRLSSKLSTKTPKSSVSVEGSKSTVTKSNRKRGVKVKEEGMTPTKKKKPDSSEQKENVPSALSEFELLRKRLTLVVSKHANQDSVTDIKKRSSGGAEISPNVDTNSDSQDDGIKRGRRTKGPVSYVPKPLNAKLRQGDSMFNGPGSKAKAEEMRLKLAQRMNVLKVPGHP